MQMRIMLKKILFFCFLTLVIPIDYLAAQESMIPNVSYTFLEKLIIAAKTNYPRYKGFEKKVEVAQLNVEKAKLDWFNLFTFSYVYSPSNATTIITPSLNGYQVAISTPLGAVFQKPNQVKNARRQLEVEETNRDEYDLNITALVKQKYFTYVQQLTVLNWRIKALEDAESTMKNIKYKFEKGEETYDNYSRILATYTSAVQSKIESEGAFLIAKSSLEEIVGIKLEDIK